MGHNFGMSDLYYGKERYGYCNDRADTIFGCTRINKPQWSRCSAMDLRRVYTDFYDNWCLEGIVFIFFLAGRRLVETYKLQLGATLLQGGFHYLVISYLRLS